MLGAAVTRVLYVFLVFIVLALLLEVFFGELTGAYLISNEYDEEYVLTAR